MAIPCGCYAPDPAFVPIAIAEVDCEPLPALSPIAIALSYCALLPAFDPIATAAYD